MNNYTAAQIIALPQTTKEQEHHSREQEGRHVFISRYFQEYGNLGDDEKLALFDSEENSVDSLDTVKLPQVWEVLGLACSAWTALSPELQDAWKQRAILLNNRPVPGLYQSVPTVFCNPSTDYHTCHGLLSNLQNFKSVMKSVVMHKPRKGSGKKKFKFGKEEFVIKTQKYKKGHLFHYNLYLCIFGNCLSNIKLCERTYIKKR